MKRILVLLVVLALAGGGYWFMQNRERFFPKPEAVQVAPQRWQLSTAQPTDTAEKLIAKARTEAGTGEAS